MGQNQKNIVILKEEEQKVLTQLTKSGQCRPREVQRAHILLLADINGPYAMPDYAISELLKCSESTVLKRRKRFALTQNVKDTLFDSPRSGRPTIVDGATEAHLTMIACSSPPEGYARWSLSLIHKRIVQLEIVDTISPSTIGRVLKKKLSSHG